MFGMFVDLEASFMDDHMVVVPEGSASPRGMALTA